MLQRLQSITNNISYLVFWIIVAVLAALTAFQLHANLILISMAIINNPTLRPTGWSTDTIYGLSRVFWLVLGIFWLGLVMYSERNLYEGKNQGQLLKRFTLLIIILGVIYGVSYIVPLLM
jgi:hypothetical protein